MDFLEFLSDHYASLFVDQNFKGFFNKIPLLRRLQLREAASVKLLFDGIRNQNNPDQDPNLHQLLRDERGQATTFALDRQPYVEAGLGMGNIFKVLRLDVVRRFPYLYHPNVAAQGLRGRFKVSF